MRKPLLGVIGYSCELHRSFFPIGPVDVHVTSDSRFSGDYLHRILVDVCVYFHHLSVVVSLPVPFLHYCHIPVPTDSAASRPVVAFSLSNLQGCGTITVMNYTDPCRSLHFVESTGL